MADGNGEASHEQGAEQGERDAKGQLLPGHSVGEDTRFGAGESGNPRGRPKTKAITNVLEELLKEDLTDKAGNVKNRTRLLAEKWFQHAFDGKSAYFLEMMNRIEGKIVQALEVDGNIGVEFVARLKEQAKEPGRLFSLMSVLRDAGAIEPTKPNGKPESGNGDAGAA